MICASLLEVISIGSVVPFLGALTNPNKLFESQIFKPFFNVFNISSAEQVLLPLTITFSVAAIAAGIARLALLKFSIKLSFGAGADLSNSIYRRTLYQPYTAHIARNSSEVIDGISGKANSLIYSVIMPILTIFSSLVVIIGILGALIFLDPWIAISSFLLFGSLYVGITWFTRLKKIHNSQIIAKESTKVIKCLQEGLGGIRDVLIDAGQETYCQIYRRADERLRKGQGENQFIAQSPRYAMEALGIVLIAFLAYGIAHLENDSQAVIPLLGALALGAQRLLPIMQQAYAAWATIQGSNASLQDVLELLDQPIPAYSTEWPIKPLKFDNSILLRMVSFRYNPSLPMVIKDLNLTIAKGSRVGIVGMTGGGKSTLIDIIMGLLPPTSGKLVVDGQDVNIANQRSWFAHIAHVPQVIFLADSTIAENIAFGVSKDCIDYDRVSYCAQQAQIAASIESWPDGYETFVGERGIRLSGGQRQRIGIARALYKKVDVIVFDEATSALDNETEEAIMRAIDSLDKNLTILIVAHRLTTLRNCSAIIKIKDGRIEGSYSYQDMLNLLK
jgi:ATP-binding cassette subfamily B protein